MSAHRFTVSKVVEAGLCLGCGTCDLVCKAGGVTLRETAGGFLAAQVDPARCTSCGMCTKVCPGLRLEPSLLRQDMDPFTGPVLAAYLAQATDPHILSGAQSGGAVSALLCHLLQTGAISGAVVTTMPADGSLRPRAIIARTKDEVLQARGSKYCPVALNSALKTADDVARGSLAIVGLPCHIHGFRNAQIACPEAVGGVGFTIGLICLGVLSYHAIDHLIEQAGADASDALELRYRSKARDGWPGDVHIRSKDGSDHWLPAAFRHRCKLAFEALPCRLCFDQMNILSDITVGDPWGLDERKEGISVVLARTQAGVDTLLSAEKEGALTLQPVSAAHVFEGQTVDFRQRRDWSAFTAAWVGMGHTVPDFGVEPQWREGTAGLKLKPYRARLLHALRLSRAQSKSEAMRIAHRRLKQLRLQSVTRRLLRLASPRRVALDGARKAWRCLTKTRVSETEGRPVRVVMFGAHFTGNLGGPSVILGTKSALSRYIPNANYTLLYPGKLLTQERRTAAEHGLNVVPLNHAGKRALLSALVWRFTRLRTGSPHARRVVDSLLDADLVVDVSGIAFTDRFGQDTLRSRMRRHTLWLVAKLLGRPLVKYTSAFGPCRQRWNRFFTKFYLGECSELVLARDFESYREIRRAGVSSPAMVCPDAGFLLQAVESEESRRVAAIRAERPVVGISVSHQAESRAPSPGEYHSAMAALVRHITEYHGAHVVLIPNEVYADASRDDARVAQAVLSQAGDTRCEIVNATLLSAEQLKGVIGQCGVVVAARYHTLIAALSLRIPVLAVSWHHKYVEALRLFGQEEYLIDICECSGEKITEVFERFWSSREAIKRAILSRLPRVLQRIEAGARRAAAVVSPTPEQEDEGIR